MRVGDKIAGLKDYRAPLLVVLLGLFLLLLPTEGADEKLREKKAAEFDRLQLQEEMEQMLCRIEGVGELHLMLMVDADSAQELAADINSSSKDKEQRTVVLDAGGGREEVVVTRSRYPAFTGALVVCEGAGSAAVRYEVTAAVSVLTGLSSNRISVVKGEG